MRVWSVTNNDIIVLTMAVYLGTVFSNFFAAFSKDILSPILRKLLPEKLVSEYHYEDIRYGAFIIEILGLVVGVAMAILFAKFARRYAGSVFQHLYR